MQEKASFGALLNRYTVIHLLPPSMLRYQDEPSNKNGLFVRNFVLLDDNG